MGTMPTAHDWTAGDNATSSLMETLSDSANYALGRATSGGSRKPLFIGSLTVSQSLTSGTDTALLLDTENLDYDGGHSTVTNTSRYTGQTAGWYFVFCGAQFASNATGYRQVGIGQNGGAPSVLSAQTIPAVNGAATVVQASSIVQLNGTTDYVEARALQTSGGALNVAAARLYVALLSA